MNWEILKPIEGGSGISRPFLRVDLKANKVTLNMTTRRMLEVEQGGAIQVARDGDSGRLYVIKVSDGRASNLYHITKNGHITDLALPSRLMAYADMKGENSGRVFLAPNPIKHEGKEAYQVLKEQ